MNPKRILIAIVAFTIGLLSGCGGDPQPCSPAVPCPDGARCLYHTERNPMTGTVHVVGLCE